MIKSTQKRMGRPLGSDFPNLLHVRISEDMVEALEKVAKKRLDRPSTAQLVREALALLIEREAKPRK